MRLTPGYDLNNINVYGNELKNKITRFIQKIKDRNEYLMISFHVEIINAIYNVYIIGSNCSFSAYTKDE